MGGAVDRNSGLNGGPGMSGRRWRRGGGVSGVRGFVGDEGPDKFEEHSGWKGEKPETVSLAGLRRGILSFQFVDAQVDNLGVYGQGSLVDLTSWCFVFASGANVCFL